MKALLLSIIVLAASPAHAEAPSLAADQLNAKVVEVTNAQNKVMMQGSTAADVDALFALYAPDFVYVHEVYGGTYTREQLYKNTLRIQGMGRYDLKAPRYKLVATIPGHNGIAVEREEISNGLPKRHLAVFEFKQDKISKITEYWK